MTDLKDKTALVTGASKGIGAACAIALAEQGANIIINYHSDDAAAQSVAEQVKKLGRDALLVKADIANPEARQEMFASISKKYKTIDVLVNNVGIFIEGDSPHNITAIRQLFEVNLFSQIEVTNEVLQVMPRGKIIFISSIHGKLGNGRPTATGYSASKAALNSYIKNLAKAVAPNVLVNAVSPGRTETPMWGDMTPEFKQQYGSDQLIDRWIEPIEIADSVVYLAKNDAVCGEVLVVDGGMSLKILG